MCVCARSSATSPVRLTLAPTGCSTRTCRTGRPSLPSFTSGTTRLTSATTSSRTRTGGCSRRNIRLFAANKAIGVFEQGDGYNENANFNHLKLWLLAHLLWNPHADSPKLTAAFLAGYYGAAAPYLQQYLGLTCDATERSGIRLGCGGAASTYLTLGDMNEASVLFDKAAAVKGDPDLLRRVQVERLALDHAWLLGSGIDRFAPGSLYADDYKALAQTFVEKSREWGAPYLSEGKLIPDDYAVTLADRGSKKFKPLKPVVTPAAVPERCRACSPEDWLDVQESRFLLANPGNWVTIVSDDAAANARAAMMPGGTTSGRRSSIWRNKTRLCSRTRSASCRSGAMRRPRQAGRSTREYVTPAGHGRWRRYPCRLLTLPTAATTSTA